MFITIKKWQTKFQQPHSLDRKISKNLIYRTGNWWAELINSYQQKLSLPNWNLKREKRKKEKIQCMLLQKLMTLGTLKWKVLCLQSTIKLLFLLSGLESAMSKLGWGVYELEFDVFQSHPRCLFEKGLTKSENPLLGSNTASLHHNVIILHNTIMWESTHRRNILLSPVIVKVNLANKSHQSFSLS